MKNLPRKTFVKLLGLLFTICMIGLLPYLLISQPWTIPGSWTMVVKKGNTFGPYDMNFGSDNNIQSPSPLGYSGVYRNFGNTKGDPILMIFRENDSFFSPQSNIFYGHFDHPNRLYGVGSHYEIGSPVSYWAAEFGSSTPAVPLPASRPIINLDGETLTGTQYVNPKTNPCEVEYRFESPDHSSGFTGTVHVESCLPDRNIKWSSKYATINISADTQLLVFGRKENDQAFGAKVTIDASGNITLEGVWINGQHFGTWSASK